MEQLSIFDLMSSEFKIDKPVRLIELFAGYGSQALALKYLGIPFSHHRICEWAVKSIQAYKDLHFPSTSCKVEMTRDEMVDFLHSKGISSDYNKPMTKKEIDKLKTPALKTIVENIKVTNNLVNIQQVKGEDLGIEDTDKYVYILCYSFPCQDLSYLGLQKGYSDASTRSGMVWEVVRILNECKELGELPQVLIMENVIAVHDANNISHFARLIRELDALGYRSFWQDMKASDYGVPQIRNRTFMVSLLGNYNYKFPPAIPLEKKLKDVLEKDVDDKYYLSDKMVKNALGNAINPNLKDAYDRSRKMLNKETAYTIMTKVDRRVGDSNYIVGDGSEEIMVKDYLHDNNIEPVAVYDYNTSDEFMGNKSRWKSGEVFTTIRTMPKNAVVFPSLKMRKLTEKECFRLQGVRDDDSARIMANQTQTSSYHLAGDSICVDVLMKIFNRMV